MWTEIRVILDLSRVLTFSNRELDMPLEKTNSIQWPKMGN